MCLQVVFEIVHYLERYYNTQASDADHMLGPFGQVAEHSSKRHQRSDPEQPLDSYEQVTQPSSAAWSSATGSPAQHAPTEQSLDCCVQLQVQEAHFRQLTVLHKWFISPVHSDWPVSGRLFKTGRLYMVLDPPRLVLMNQSRWIKYHVKPASDWPVSGLDRTGHTRLSNNNRSSMTGSWAQLFQTD